MRHFYNQDINAFINARILIFLIFHISGKLRKGKITVFMNFLIFVVFLKEMLTNCIVTVLASADIKQHLKYSTVFIDQTKNSVTSSLSLHPSFEERGNHQPLLTVES